MNADPLELREMIASGFSGQVEPALANLVLDATIQPGEVDRGKLPLARQRQRMTPLARAGHAMSVLFGSASPAAN